ncbi:hypothetical protein RB195_013535 [Necator americanus]|uniref:Uncharacterized protein n=1 Tax=Necator americanus TaxID=51031 RepID=A0ABR1DVZ0_NECAM
MGDHFPTHGLKLAANGSGGIFFRLLAKLPRADFSTSCPVFGQKVLPQHSQKQQRRTFQIPFWLPQRLKAPGELIDTLAIAIVELKTLVFRDDILQKLRMTRFYSQKKSSRRLPRSLRKKDAEKRQNKDVALLHAYG